MGEDTADEKKSEVADGIRTRNNWNHNPVCLPGPQRQLLSGERLDVPIPICVLLQFPKIDCGLHP